MSYAKGSFEANADALREKLAKRGYARTNKPVNLRRHVDAELITDCEIVARKDFFNMLYLEAYSNWKRVAAGATRAQNGPCVVFAKYDEARTIAATLTERLSKSPRPRYLVISSKPALEKFLNKIKASAGDTTEEIDDKVMKAFDSMSAYNDAMREFGSNLEDIIKKTKALIEERIRRTPQYAAEAEAMLKTCRDVVSDKMTVADIKDMLIQHVMTYKIFEMVYDDSGFHTTNAVAKLLEKLKRMLKIPDSTVNYKTLELIAESLVTTDEKQEFLKSLYATFYKKYDPKKAANDGIVYTPKQAVGFMTRSVKILLARHFDKTISDKDVHILDPATGTGTFIVEMLRAIEPEKLGSKYAAELHANEIYVLPYYIAALNIEHVYYELSGKKADFQGICWTDTLELKRGLDVFIDDDNAKRISRQRRQPIFVVIGNPPYAVAKNYVAERYPDLYQTIQAEWRSGKGTKKVNMDLYKVFLKWAEERVKNRGIVAFISNNSFTNASGDFQMRQSLYGKFDHIYIINLKGNGNIAGEARRREKGNVFGNQAKVGICISFFVKTGDGNGNNLQHAEIPDYLTEKNKLEWLDNHDINTVHMVSVTPKEPKWNLCPPLPKTDWNTLPPLLDGPESIFSEYVLGIQTNKDQWVYSISASSLEKRVKYYAGIYNACITPGTLDKKIKWTREVKKELYKNTRIIYDRSKIKICMYRPFVKRFQYTDDTLIDWFRQTQFVTADMVLLFPNHTPNAQFGAFITDKFANSACVGETRGIPLHASDEAFNITEWGLSLFRSYYNDESISARDVFYYTYAILNDPKYIKKYEHDLRTSFPRIPLAENFGGYKELGRELASLHTSYEKAKPYPLKRVDSDKPPTKVKLAIAGNKITIDDATTLEGLPIEAVQYMVGTRPALGWVLEFYKETKHSFKVGDDNKCDTHDQAVADRFNTYRFADHKDDAIDLLRRVTTVSVESMRLKQQLEALKWGSQPNLKFTLSQEKASKPRNKKPGRRRTSKNQTLGVKNEVQARQ